MGTGREHQKVTVDANPAAYCTEAYRGKFGGGRVPRNVVAGKDSTSRKIKALSLHCAEGRAVTGNDFKRP
jgi:hypothetical protein